MLTDKRVVTFIQLRMGVYFIIINYSAVSIFRTFRTETLNRLRVHMLDLLISHAKIIKN